MRKNLCPHVPNDIFGIRHYVQSGVDQIHLVGIGYEIRILKQFVLTPPRSFSKGHFKLFMCLVNLCIHSRNQILGLIWSCTPQCRWRNARATWAPQSTNWKAICSASSTRWWTLSGRKAHLHFKGNFNPNRRSSFIFFFRHLRAFMIDNLTLMWLKDWLRKNLRCEVSKYHFKQMRKFMQQSFISLNSC